VAQNSYGQKLKVATIVGARPQFIKVSPVSDKLRQKFHEILIHTGQHYDYNMSRVFFEELNIPEPDYHLGVGSGSHGLQTGLMLQEVEKVLRKEKPMVVLVYGDTNSTLAGALAAAKLNLTMAHVEAGLRSFNRAMPEEINRVLTDHISQLLFCPTETAAANLATEGIEKGVHLVGDVMYDAALYYGKIADQRSNALDRLTLRPKEYFLATIHRAENTDNPENLSSIIGALHECPMPVILPLHPRTKAALGSEYPESYGSCKFIPPVSYLDMLKLEKNARTIFTDSGGIQKEAYFFRVPCITLRGETEWVETVSSGWNRLVGADRKRILSALSHVNEPPPVHKEYYGDGNASERIVEIIDRETRREKVSPGK
jgi:UDP-N-acetylglucosamine 2-epimerase